MKNNQEKLLEIINKAIDLSPDNTCISSLSSFSALAAIDTNNVYRAMCKLKENNIIAIESKIIEGRWQNAITIIDEKYRGK